MSTMNAMAWSLLALFMLHEFEEIILIHPWMIRNKGYIERAHAKNKKVPFDFFTSASSASLAIYEEFIIVSAVILLSCIFDSYLVWYGLFAAFTVHLVIHIIFSVIHHRYVPGLITSGLVLLPSVYILCISAIEISYGWSALLLSTVFVSVLMLLNLEALHKSVKTFDGWIEKFSEEK